jgi:serine/threonine protein phosphatase 1
MSDIHGEYDRFLEMMKLIDLKNSDDLYIIGDVLDRGPHPVRLLLDIMQRPNVCLLAGNHEYMAATCMNILFRELTDDFLDSLDAGKIAMISEWQLNGGDTTIKELKEADPETRSLIFDYLADLELYEELTVNSRQYVLVHGGFAGFDPVRPLWDYSADELVWTRPDYSRAYFKDRYVISGHTPTQLISENPLKGSIFRNCNHIAIDCGCTFGGRLACLCLDNEAEFYV